LIFDHIPENSKSKKIEDDPDSKKYFTLLTNLYDNNPTAYRISFLDYLYTSKYITLKRGCTP